MRETSGVIRKKYINDVLGPLPEPVKTMMREAFDNGVAVGMVAAAEMMYATVDELTMSAKFIIEQQNPKISKGGETSDSTQNRD